MRVVRGKSFETEQGSWEKLEIELDDRDLLPDELKVAAQLQPLLLETRAEQQLSSFLRRLGKVSAAEAKEVGESLKKARQDIFALDKKQKGSEAPRARLMADKHEA